MSGPEYVVDLLTGRSVGTGRFRATKQLTSLSEIYTVASTRFTNLETQYRELEKEFTKLIEKELSGKF